MKMSTFSEEQIAYVLRQVEGDSPGRRRVPPDGRQRRAGLPFDTVQPSGVAASPSAQHRPHCDDVSARSRTRVRGSVSADLGAPPAGRLGDQQQARAALVSLRGIAWRIDDKQHRPHARSVA